MQSFLQYRQFGQDARHRYTTEQAKLAQSPDCSGVSSPHHAPTPDLADQAEQSLAGRPDLNEASEDPDLEALEENEQQERTAPGAGAGLSTTLTQHSTREHIGHALEDVSPRERTTHEGKGDKVFVVGWSGVDDPANPHNWSETKKMLAVLRVTLIAFAVTMASSIDSAVLVQAARDLHVSEVAESLATGNYLIGFGVGTLLAGPLSEALGRNFVYIGSLAFFMVWILGAALAPNFGAQITFRWLAGFFGSPALTLSGGTIADLYDPLSKTYAFPIFAISGFGGPILGPVMSAWIGPSSHVSWRWAEWVSLLVGGITLAVMFLTQPETYAPLLLSWKASQLRKVTGDHRFRAELEVVDEGMTRRVASALARPFVLIKTELIVGLMTLYLTTVYIVLFTFLDGYTYIFERTYGISQGLSFTIFVAMFVGVLLSLLEVPLIYSWTKTHLERNRQAAIEDGEKEPSVIISPETRLWFAMIGAPAMPISLFWMGWTDYSSISIWSPILASTLFGFGVINIFMSAYMYIIDSYEIYAASALTFVALVRYLAAGGMTVVGIPFYENVGTHWTLSSLGIIAAVCCPIPYALYIWGPKVRRFSKYAVNKSG